MPAPTVSVRSLLCIIRRNSLFAMKLCTFGQQSQIHQLMELIASASEVTTVWHYRNFIVIIIIRRRRLIRRRRWCRWWWWIFVQYPVTNRATLIPSVSRIPRGFEKNRKKIVGVTITPGSPQTQTNRVAARRWIAALARKRAGTKKLSLARRRSDDWFSWPEVRKVRCRLINWSESLDRNWLKKVVCCKTRIFVFFLGCRQLGYWSSFSGSRGNIRVCQGSDNCDVPNKRSTSLPRNQSKSIGPFPVKTT